MFNSSAERKPAKRIRVYDCRDEKELKVPEKWLETSGLDFNGFLRAVHKEFAIRSHERHVVVTTDRTVLDYDRFEGLPDGSTVHLLLQENQALPRATEERINFMPHYDTIIKSGTYGYYASAGQKPLPFALAELIDNALSATAKNTGVRTIEIRMMFDETLGRPAVIVLDNGCGMTSKQLTNWAVYRLSKFARTSNTETREEGYVRPDPVPRSLNSDISYFGVGGKQAAFYIGESTRMITKPAGLPDVHELLISKEDFERKERNKENIYGGCIINRKPGDSSHVSNSDEQFLHTFIAEECGKESFTAVVITGILPEHIFYLKDQFEVWTKELAHIYHYYIHGVTGNDMRSSSAGSNDLPKIDIQVTLREKPSRCPRVMNLREVDQDMETLYINAAVDTFEFKAATEQGGTVEGVIRYHPFLYDRETYPKDPHTTPEDNYDDDDDYDENDQSGVLHQARGQRPIFDCFWNGRLIPYTTVSEFDWCARPRVGADVPAECYRRFSGVLFTDDRFEVSTNKLTFMELELKLKNRSTSFTRYVNGQKQRCNMHKEFKQWLQHCHEKWDKQIEFLGYMETITRTDVPTKKMQHPWATFSSIKWDGKTYRKGQLLKSRNTKPILYGTVVRFLLYGEYKKDVYATGGRVEVAREPKALYDQTKIIPISKIDKTATDEAVTRNIDSDNAKLPDKLSVEWPEKNPWPLNAVRVAGTPLGPLRIQIMNKKGRSLSTMPSVSQGAPKKLVIELKIIQHGTLRGDQEVISHVAQNYAKWDYWFKKIESLTNLGKYTLCLSTLISEGNINEFGGRELPSYKLSFTIKEGAAESFDIGAVSSTVNVGEPFDIPLQVKDAYGHPTTPPANFKPSLTCSGLDLSYENVKSVDTSGASWAITGVKARGKVNYHHSNTYDLMVVLPGLKQHTQIIKISLLPGHPHSLHVTPEDHIIEVENRNPVKFNVEIHDEAGNLTARPAQIVRCQVQGFPYMLTNCSNTGAGQFTTKPISVKLTEGGPQKLAVQFDMPSQKNVAPVMKELKVVPSTRVALMALCRRSEEDEKLLLRDKEKIEWLAGGSLENLFYILYDEACRNVPLTAEIASKIKVNWTADLDLKDLQEGKLPDIQVPTQVQEERFYQVSYQDQSVCFSFNIVPRPDEPKQLKATLPQNTVKLGETLPGNIILVLVDQYDNVTTALTSTCVANMTVKAEDLDKSAIEFIWQESSRCVLVKGVQFQSGTPGSREMCFAYRGYVAQVILKVTAGDPAQLKLISAPQRVLNDHGIATPFLVQLFDKWGNVSVDQRVVVELRSSNPMLKVKADVISQPVNAEGKASFNVTSVSGPKGYYQLDFRASINEKPIGGPSVNLTVIPDPNKPVSLSVEYDTNARFPVGGKFPVFSVTVVSDEGSPITTLNPAAASMLLWMGSGTPVKTPPQNATELKCSKPMENEKNDCFHFRDKEIPEQVGKHTIQFSLRIDSTRVLFSKQITLNVVANEPVKLGPDSQPPSPAVSYSKCRASRTLVENMTLKIMDSYGNPTGQDLDGKVVVSIKSSSRSSSKNIPLFEGRTNSVQFKLVEGKAHIIRLAVMEDSPGEDGTSYVLVFKPEVTMAPAPLAAFELPFHFYNDAENQRKMSALSKKKDELTTAINDYQNIFSLHSQLHQSLTKCFEDASRNETKLRCELNRRNMNIEPTVSIADVDRLLAERNSEIVRIQRVPTRVCSIRDNFRSQPDVLGVVGHLAFVQDDDAARVISWHISGDMDCVVTRTIAAARRIYDDTRGAQQVMSLDSVYMPPGDRPLPHIRNGSVLFDPPGNPVHARRLLIYREDEESCDIVFKNFLGDTILIDDLDSANMYRKAVVQNRMQCPTILTRQGDRVSGKGKFGGAQNKAPPINTLRVFGAPPPQLYNTLSEEIALLRKYRPALQHKDRITKEREDSLKTMGSIENVRKRQDMEEKMKQLEEIERQLVSTPVRPGKRGPEDAGETSGILPKRHRPT